MFRTEACSSNLTLCPNCKSCKTKQLMDFCSYFRYADLNDNLGSVVFACAMSYWGTHVSNKLPNCAIYQFIRIFVATFFMEFWKREQAILMTRWNINSGDDMTCRQIIIFYVICQKSVGPVLTLFGRITYT